MRDEELIERAAFVPYDEFVRAHHLLASPEAADAAVHHTVEQLRANPENELVLGPEFLAVLALFSERGREIAERLIARDELHQLQSRMARARPTIAREFPEAIGDSS